MQSVVNSESKNVASNRGKTFKGKEKGRLFPRTGTRETNSNQFRPGFTKQLCTLPLKMHRGTGSNALTDEAN